MRVLDQSDLAAVTQLAQRDVVQHVFIASRIKAGCLDSRLRAGQLWGHFTGDQLTSALYVGGNVVPLYLSVSAARDFARELNRASKTYSSVVGPKSDVDMLWPLIESFTGPARLVREHQPYMMLNAAPLIAPDARVRKARVTDLDSYFDASVEMFTQEVGIDPTALGSAPYKARVLESIEQGKSFGLFDDAGRTLFKCDVGSVAHGVAQLQGVWLSPELRGRGLSASLIASAVTLIQESHAPTCALYVNDFNLAAIRSYERVGFAAVGEFATVFL